MEVYRRPFSVGTSFTPRPLYPQKTIPVSNEGCVVPRAGLDVLEKRINVLTLLLVIETIL
jgi:hypothetical protein